MPSTSTLQILRKIARTPMQRHWLVLEAIFWLLVARLALTLFPFQRIGKRIGDLHPPSAEELEQPSYLKPLAKQITWSIDRAVRLLPFRIACLPRALAAWQMLHHRGIAGRLHFGAEPPAVGEKLRTHAWLDVSGIEVTGYPEAHRCVEIGYFTR